MTSTATSTFIASAVSDKGLSEKRPVNEDSYLELPERGLFAVADGVGGAQAGDVASQMAMEVLFEAFSHPQPNVDTEELMEMAIQRANQSIYQMSHDLPQLDMMATTIVALHLNESVATIGHVGDSRLYRLDAHGNLFRETQDHSVVEEEVRAGRMTVSQAANHPSRNVISRALGAEDTVEVDMKTIMYEPGTVFLLCSDGVTRHLDDSEIRDILRSAQPPVELCGEIKDLCYSRGAEDNLTAVIIRTTGDGEATQLSEEDDETTLAGIRQPETAFKANGLATAVDKQTGDEARTDKLPPLDNQADTAPLQESATMKFAETGDFDLEKTISDEGVVDQTAATEKTSKTAPDVDQTTPLHAYETITPPKNNVAPILTYLLILLVGMAIGAVLLYLFMGNRQTVQPPTAQPAAQNPVGSSRPPIVSDLDQREANEYSSYERIRRRFDDNPIAAPNTAPPQTAADYYLRGRAFLQTGRYEEALQSLKTAQQTLVDARDVDPETLRVDIAFALAAVAAMANNQNEERMLGELIREKQSAATSATRVPAP